MTQISDLVQAILILVLHDDDEDICICEEFCEVPQGGCEFLPQLYEAIDLALSLLSPADDALPLLFQPGEFGDKLSPKRVGKKSRYISIVANGATFITGQRENDLRCFKSQPTVKPFHTSLLLWVHGKPRG